MTKLEEFGVPGNGAGILQPHVRNRFQVKFLRGGVEIEGSDSLSQEVIRVSPLRMHSGSKHTYMDMTFQDDVLNLVQKTLQNEIQKSGTLQIHINYMDGADNIIRTHILNNVKIQELEYCDLDYAATSIPERFSMIFPSKYEVNELPPSFFDGLRGTRIEVERPAESIANTIFIKLYAEEVLFHYPKRK